MARKILHQPSTLETMPNKMFYEIFIPSVLLVLIAAIAALHHFRPRFFPGLWNTLRDAVVRLYTYVQRRWTERTSQAQQNSNVASTSHTQPADGATQPPPAAILSQQASNAGPSVTGQTLPRDGIELQRLPDTDQNKSRCLSNLQLEMRGYIIHID